MKIHSGTYVIMFTAEQMELFYHTLHRVENVHTQTGQEIINIYPNS